MPMYQYFCAHCFDTKDIIVKLDERDDSRQCEKCSGDMIRDTAPHAAGLQFKGVWYKTHKTY